MMKRIVAGLFVLMLVALALLLVVPNFIDWNKHKDTLAVHATAYLQRDVKIGGDIVLRLLPNPQMSVMDVTVSSIEGAKSPYLLKLKQLEAKVRFKPLLEGHIEIEKIHLVEPELVLEVLADGRASWQGLMQGDAARKPFVFGDQGDAITLEDVTLKGGRIRYVQAASGVDMALDHLNLSVAAPSLRGPYKIVGDMRFRDVPVNVEATSGLAAEQGMPIAVLFQPLEKLPQLSLKGAIGKNAEGAFYEGDIALEQGAPASLFTQEFLTAPVWLQQDMTVNAKLSMRPGALTLSDIEGRSGKNGKLSGAVTLSRPPMEIPQLSADLKLEHLPMGGKADAQPALPNGMRAKISLTAQDALWRGQRIPEIKLDAQSDADIWHVKSLRARLAAKTQLDAEGTVRPQQQTQSFKISFSTADMAGFAKTYAAILPPAAAAILPHIPVQEVKLDGNLDIRTDRISLYNFNASSGADGKAGGVVNFANKETEARLNLSGLSWGEMTAEQRTALMTALFAAGNDIDITAGAQRFAETDFNNIVLKAAAAAGDIRIEKFSGNYGADNAFALSGNFSSWPPEGAETAALDFTLKGSDAAAIGKLAGFVWPMPLNAAAPMDVQGSWRRSGGQNTYSLAGGFRGGTVDIKKPVADGPRKLVLSMPDSQGLLALMGMDIDRLVSPAGPAVLSADVTGDDNAYVLDGLRLSVKDAITSGRAEKNDKGITADLRSSMAQFDRWLAADIRQSAPLTLKLRADKAEARGLALQTLDADMTVTSSKVDIRAIKAGVWGGTAQARGALTRDENRQWTAKLEGDIQSFRPLQIPHGIVGVTADEGDMTFDITAKPQDKAAFGDIAGVFALSLPRLDVQGFDPAELAAYLDTLKGAPQDLATVAHKTLRSGAASYSDVNIDFTREANIVTLKSLSLNNADSSVKVDGTLDSAAAKYDIKAFLTLKALRDLDPLEITRAGDVTSAPDLRFDAKPLTAFAQARMPVVVEPAEALPAVETAPVGEDAEMLPPGYLSVPPEGVPPPPDETGEEDLTREILPVEEESLSPPPADTAAPEAEPALPPQPAPAEDAATAAPTPDAAPADNPIGGILDRLGQ